MRLDVRRIESLKNGNEIVGNRTRVKVAKNKVAPPFKQAEFDILYGKGISREGSLIDMGVDAGIVRKAGAWFTYGDDQLGQGKENARTFLITHPEVASDIEHKIRVKLGLDASDEVPEGSIPGPGRSWIPRRASWWMPRRASSQRRSPVRPRSDRGG